MDLNLSQLPTLAGQALREAFRWLFRMELVDTRSVVAGAQIQIGHKLGVTPKSVLVSPSANCVVWADGTDRSLWDSTKIVVRCSSADTALQILVLG